MTKRTSNAPVAAPKNTDEEVSILVRLPDDVIQKIDAVGELKDRKRATQVRYTLKQWAKKSVEELAAE